MSASPVALTSGPATARVRLQYPGGVIRLRVRFQAEVATRRCHFSLNLKAQKSLNTHQRRIPAILTPYSVILTPLMVFRFGGFGG